MARQRDYSAEYARRQERAKDLGYESYWQQRQTRASHNFQERKGMAEDKLGTRLRGAALRDWERKLNEFQAHKRGYEQQGKKMPDHHTRKAARMLVDLGLRDPGDRTRVGQTKRKKK